MRVLTPPVFKGREHEHCNGLSEKAQSSGVCTLAEEGGCAWVEVGKRAFEDEFSSSFFPALRLCESLKGSKCCFLKATAF